MHLSALDLAILFSYFAVILFIGGAISRMLPSALPPEKSPPVLLDVIRKK